MLRIELHKQPDGAVVLRCIRADGSVTWQKQTRHAAHFVLHDLTHFAVETTLGFRQGFLGLVEEGWDLEETTGTGLRGPLPPETVEVEQIVGLFDTERGSGILLTTDEFNQYAPRKLSAEQIQTIHNLRLALFRQWFELLPNDKLELTFTKS